MTAGPVHTNLNTAILFGEAATPFANTGDSGVRYHNPSSGTLKAGLKVASSCKYTRKYRLFWRLNKAHQKVSGGFGNKQDSCLPLAFTPSSHVAGKLSSTAICYKGRN
jgi:hypothetical protein